MAIPDDVDGDVDVDELAIQNIPYATTRQRALYSDALSHTPHTTHRTLLPPPPPKHPPHKKPYSTGLNHPLKQRIPAASLYKPRPLAPAPAPAAAPSPASAPAPAPVPAEPKVLVAYKQEAGRAPRKVVIERQRRYFGAQDLASLLLNAGVDVSTPEPKDAPPLHVFDDEEYDPRPLSEWAAIPDLTAQFLERGTDGRGSWRACVVVSYDTSRRLFSVRSSPATETTLVPRVDLCFDVEDPFRFAERVAAAHAARAAASEVIKAHFLIDCMPHIDGQMLEKERFARMLSLSATTARLTERARDSAPLFDEVQFEYSRTMSYLALCAAVAKANGGSSSPSSTSSVAGTDAARVAFLRQLHLPPPPTPPPVPERAMIADVPPHAAFTETRGFAFHTFLSTREVIAAILKIRGECATLDSLNLFDVAFTKCVTAEEFQQLQQTHLAPLLPYLRETWTTSLKNIIRGSLRDVGKGWFNLRESKHDVYAVSKIRRLLKMVTLMMQDTVTNLADASLISYVDLVVKRSSAEVSIGASPKDVALSMPHGGDAPVPPPLFALQLVVNDGEGISYRDPPSRFKEVVVPVYMTGIAAVQGIPQIEQFVMDKLFWSETPVLQTVDPSEGVVPEQLARLVTALDHGIAPAARYLELFDEYLGIVRTDEAAFAEKYEADERHISELVTDVRRHEAQGREAAHRLPLSTRLGLFQVDCSQLRRFVIDRHARLAEIIRKRIAKAVRAQGNAISRLYQEIVRQLLRPLHTIEDVAEVEEYIANLPAELADLAEQLAELRRSNEIVEGLESPAADDDFKAFYSTLAWPMRVREQEVKVREAAAARRVECGEAQLAEQAAYAKTLERLEKACRAFDRHTDFDTVDEVAAEARRLQAELADADEKRALFNRREAILGAGATDYSSLSKTAKAFEPYALLWTTAADWLASREQWLGSSFSELDAEGMDASLQASLRTMAKLVRTFAGVAGLDAITERVKRELDDFSPTMPLIVALRNPGMRERHWAELTEETGKDLSVATSSSFTLQRMIDLKLEDDLAAVTKVSDHAGKEFAIEEALDKMLSGWADVKLEVVAYRETGTFVRRGADVLQQLLDDHMVMTQAMAFSPFKGPYGPRIEEWERTLTLVSDVTEEWMKVQRNWMYLQPIFDSDDIMRQLPTEAKRFASVDRSWRKLMLHASNETDPIAFCKTPNVLRTWQDSNQMLELVQKGLSEYLETKRVVFSRFYFLSNDELLEILSQSKDPLAVQPHLKKCFENIDKLKFEDDLRMTAMISGEGEHVPFTKALKPECGVEFWMREVLYEMKATVRQTIIDACDDYRTTPRSEWVLKWPGATLIAGSAIFWTLEVDQALRKAGNAGITEYADQVTSQLLELTQIVSGKVTKLQRKSLGALITIDVHARDVTNSMRDAGVSDVSDFAWISQLRYELLAAEPAAGAPGAGGFRAGDTLVKQLDGVFGYGNEYLGNSMRLVVTPLTDRIYLTLTGALQLFLGGAPAGPAGTGKTETTKDLAKAMAKQCVVFNCQEGLDFLAMGKFFKGLAMSGAWACFDEFNRIDLEVLSVVAQQVSSIQQAMQAGLKRFTFEGEEISLDMGNAIFITMNPGYAGRSELPDNLKALFRPVACMVPDYALIAEIRLYSFGYKDARRLSKKMVKTFQLASEQVSAQDHYDFGMRAVNTVIQAAGNNRQANPDEAEDLLVLSALADSNRPKFLAEDMLLFDSILSDLFPGWEVPAPDYTELIETIKAECAAARLVPTDFFLAKCIQIYEVSVLRHGYMTVGPSGGAKSSAKDMLIRAMAKLDATTNGEEGTVGTAGKYTRTRQWILNPKAVTMGQLYGQFDENTHEWTDGIICILYRAAVNEFAQHNVTDKQWLVFDGPVDALWIESMNTVLDDNKKLCLVSGEIITMSPHMTMVFEVEDLAVASPATVSRVGTIFMEPERVVGIGPQIESWLMGLPAPISNHRERLGELLNALLPHAVAFVRKSCKEYVSSVDNNLVASTLNVLQQFWRHYVPVDGKYEVPDELADALPRSVEKHVVFALVWGAGASTDTASRRRYDQHLRAALAAAGVAEAAELPAEGLVYDYALNLEEASWVGWLSTAPEYRLSPKTPFEDIIVPTVDTVRYTYVIEQLVTHGFHVLAIGPTGTGKTLNVGHKLMSDMPDQYTPLFVGFSAQTTANMTQDQLDNKLDKRRKGVFGPPSGKRYVVFVDDLNMPQREEYGAQPPIEILRQWMGHGGWYDRKDHEFRRIVDISFVGAMGPPGGGRQMVTNRFLRYFNFLTFPELEDSAMRHIFSCILSTFVGAYLPEPLLALCGPLVEATIHLYNVLVKELLPTPAKPHYTFNLRDVAAVMQGLLAADAKSVLERADLCRLWLHECSRVFRDRLVSPEDRDWLDALVADKVVPSHLAPDVLGCPWSDVVPAGGSAALAYGDFMEPDADPRVYAEIRDARKMISVVEDYLEEYNAASPKKMPLVMFTDAVSHVSRISRVLRQPQGNALLLGVGGSGRQSLTRLAAAMAHFDCFQIEVTKVYGKAEWRDDLKSVLLSAGQEAKNVVFLFTDTQIVLESFLEDINNILNTGDVPNLFDDTEVAGIHSAMRPICQAANLPLTKVALYARFVKRVRAHIHICLCMSPMGEAFRTRLRNFPALVNNCTIDYFAAWPEEALRSVAHSALEETNMGTTEVGEAIVTMCGRIHQSVEVASVRYLDEQRRYNYVTPTSYLEVLSVFKTALAKKREEVSTSKRRLEIGLEKLQSTEVEVTALEKQLTEMQPVLKRTSEEVEAMMEQITKDKAEADETRSIVVSEEAVASTKAEECQQIKDSAEKDLAEALPALDAAVAVLRNLKLSDLSEVAKYANPPGGVKLVMEAMCVLKGVPPKKVGAAGAKVDDYWEPGKKMLQDGKGLLESMFSFDKDNIPEKIVARIQPYIEDPNFEPEAISKVSVACTAMCQWVRAMNKYHFVAKEVEPKRQALKGAQEELDVLTQKLSKLRANLREVEDKIAGLEAKFAESMAKKDDLAARVADATVKQDRAGRLLGGLGGEKLRWIETVRSIEQQELNLIGDVCIAAGAIVYLGPFTSEYRLSLAASWRASLVELGVVHTEGATVSMVMAEPVAVRKWQVDGLPADTVSTENGIILANARRWPLCIDPQGQAGKWIKNMESEHGVEACKPSDKEFVRTLENAVRFGKPVVMENVLEALDASLEPVLLKQTYKQGGSLVIKIGDNVIPYHHDFRFYLTSKLPNPHYAPEVSVKVTLLNFTITQEGLEDQLLGITVAEERPDLQEAKNNLVMQNAQMARQLKDIESQILKLLSESTGNILDDENLIQTLAQSKVTSNGIQAKAEEAARTEEEIDTTRNRYRPVAFRAALLFFCVADMASVDPMYQYSMPWFVDLFVRSIVESEPSADIAERLIILSDHFTYSLYENICRSLFEAHKLLFSFCCAIKILQGDGKIRPEEWRFFLAGSAGARVDAPNPDPSWLTSAVWGAVTSLAKLAAFGGIEASFVTDLTEWRAYFDSGEPHELELPGGWGARLDPLQRLCVLRCVRPDKVVPGMQSYVRDYIGARFTEPPSFDLGVSFRDSSNVLPIVFVLSPGADPYESLLKYAVEVKMSKKLTGVSLGQGQGPFAERAMNEAMERGAWVLLQNCHLAASWMPRLEAIVEQYDPAGMHRDYRLWLTSMPSSDFPVSILQNSVKMTIEPPRGIKMNMKGSYLNFDDAYLESHSKPTEFKKLLFGLCFFHALLQDRRKFGPLGFNIRYEFTAGDLKCCILQLESFVARYEVVPYTVLVNLFGHINYGGRITDDWDRRMVMTVLKGLFHGRIMDDDFALAPGGDFYLSPPVSDARAYNERIGAMPLNPQPDVFGLHANADIVCAQNETSELCGIMLSLQPKVSSGGGQTREEVIEQVALDLQSRHLELFDLDDIANRYPLSYTQSMNTVLSQECMRYNKLIAAYNSSLSSLLKALKGLVVMSSELEAMATSLFANQVPALWTKAAYPSLKPLAAWVDDLQRRLGFMRGWADSGTPSCFWISGLYFPQAFLTGTLQNYARKYKLAIDTVSFDYEVLDIKPERCERAPDDGCYIHGFFLEGASWDAHKRILVEAQPKELYTVFPMLWLHPRENRPPPTVGVYVCPAYKTLTRAGTLSTTGHSTNFVLAVELPSSEPCDGPFSRYCETFSAHWIKRAVALFCALNY